METELRPDTATIMKRFAELSPEQRKLFEKLLAHDQAANSNGFGIAKRVAGEAISLSFAQQRLWFLDQLLPGNPLYNIPSALRLSSPLNPTVLEQSLNEVVRRHEALRTSFATVAGAPVQVIAPSLRLPLPLTDLRRLPAAEREAEARRLAREEAQQ